MKKLKRGMDFNTWLVTSTINTEFSVWSPKQRLDQTLQTLKSIRQKDASAKVIFVDNSIEPLKHATPIAALYRCFSSIQASCFFNRL